MFVPALLGLLPANGVAVGARCSAPFGRVAQELTDLEKVNGGALECKLDRVTNVGRRRFARVTYTGTIDGVGEDGLGYNLRAALPRPGGALPRRDLDQHPARQGDPGR
ncbi:MAG: hypothetical protein U0797_22095 [Gemmataceae bacterium]